MITAMDHNTVKQWFKSVFLEQGDEKGWRWSCYSGGGHSKNDENDKTSKKYNNCKTYKSNYKHNKNNKNDRNDKKYKNYKTFKTFKTFKNTKFHSISSSSSVSSNSSLCLSCSPSPDPLASKTLKSLRSHLSIPTVSSCQDSSVSFIESSIFSSSSLPSCSGLLREMSAVFYSLTHDSYLDYPAFRTFYVAQNGAGPAQRAEHFEHFEHSEHAERDQLDWLALRAFQSHASAEGMSLAGFQDYLASTEHNPALATTALLQDYSRPLNEYFVSSSHNTYLVGRQVGGQSSIDCYIHALKKGCRCVEVDIWNGDNGPVVSHGLTLTSSVSLRKVAQAIRQYAFVASDLPLILSVEIHCKKAYQAVVKDVLTAELGDHLLTRSLFDDLSEPESRLPSVDQLKHKILVKIKRPSTLSAVSSDSLLSTAVTNNIFSSSSALCSSASSTEYSDDSLLDKPRKLLKPKPKPKPKSPSSFKIAPELCAMSFYIYGIKFKHFDLDDSKTFNHCFSFSNRRLSSMLKHSSRNIASIHSHNLNHLMRIYPAGYKITSKNFDPIMFWKFGCQLVATNWQTYDLGEEINESMFNHGDRSGYILKPEYLRPAAATAAQDARKPALLHNILIKNHNINSKYLQDIRFSIQIIAAELADLEIDLPYVTMQVLGNERALENVSNPSPISLSSLALQQTASSSSASSVFYEDDSLFKTHPSQALTWKTSFSGTIKSTLKDFIFLRFSINSSSLNSSSYYNYYFGSTETNTLSNIGIRNNKASSTVRLIYLQQGYRLLPLHDSQGNELPNSRLFLKISFN